MNRNAVIQKARLGLNKVLGPLDLAVVRASRLSEIGAESDRQRVNQLVWSRSDGVVMSGPFADMKLLSVSSWGDGDIGPKLLGCYEEEIHTAVDELIARAPDVIHNIGAAEGYYAIGLARRCPTATVFAYDIDAVALDLCNRAADLNGVGDRVTAEVTTWRVEDLQTQPGQRVAVVMDCEGCEQGLVSLGTLPPSLAAVDFLIEAHDFAVPNISTDLQALFAATHTVRLIREGPRNPAAVDCLQDISSSDRWTLVDEHRPEVMSWVWAKANAPT